MSVCIMYIYIHILYAYYMYSMTYCLKLAFQKICLFRMAYVNGGLNWIDFWSVNKEQRKPSETSKKVKLGAATRALWPRNAKNSEQIVSLNEYKQHIDGSGLKVLAEKFTAHCNWLTWRWTGEVPCNRILDPCSIPNLFFIALFFAFVRNIWILFLTNSMFHHVSMGVS